MSNDLTRVFLPLVPQFMSGHTYLELSLPRIFISSLFPEWVKRATLLDEATYWRARCLMEHYQRLQVEAEEIEKEMETIMKELEELA